LLAPCVIEIGAGLGCEVKTGFDDNHQHEKKNGREESSMIQESGHVGWLDFRVYR